MSAQKLAEILAVFANIVYQIVFLYDPLDLQCGGTSHRVALVRVSVGESPGADVRLGK